jgi:hypothetical protein
MALLNALFVKFLSNIEPSDKAVKYAQDAHKHIRDCLKKDEKFKGYVEGSFLYGSYRRHTAVGDIKDVDIVVLTNFDPFDKENTPQSVLRKLKAALARCYDDPENPQYQRRSIRIDDPLPDEPEVTMTLDIIPAVAVNGDETALMVPDREVKKWVWSHPKGHLEYTTQLNKPEVSNGRFVPLVKMLKWWWKYQSSVRQPEVERPKPKGFWIEILTGKHLDCTKQAWADHFIAVLEQISSEYSDVEKAPKLPDPGLPDENIKTSMTVDEFGLFMETVNETLELAYQARAEEDKLESSKLWREIFGDEFPLYDEEETEQSQKEARSTPLANTFHQLPLIWPEGLLGTYRVRIDAYVYFGGRRLGGLNSNGRVLSSGLDLQYFAWTNVPKPYLVFWQVVNTGKHAEQTRGLRGEFFKGKVKDGSPFSDPLVNWEHTHYTGKHWIQCFIIKDGKCVARSKRFYVTIRNPSYS